MQLLRSGLERRRQGCSGGADAAAVLAAVRPFVPTLAALLRRPGVACLQYATAALWLMTADPPTAATLVAAAAVPNLVALLSHKVCSPST